MPFFRPCTCTLQHIATQILAPRHPLGKGVMQRPRAWRSGKPTPAH